MNKNLITIEDFIKEIVQETGIKLDKTDPVMIMLAANKILLQQTQEIQQKIIDDYQNDMKQLSLATLTETKDNSTKLINVAVQASKNSFSNAIEQSAKEFVEILKSENIEARKADLKILDKGINKLKKLIVVAGAISIINILIAIFLLF